MLILARYRRRLSLPYLLVILLSVVALVCMVQTIPARDDRTDHWPTLQKFWLEQEKNKAEERLNEKSVAPDDASETGASSFASTKVTPEITAHKHIIVLPSMLNSLPHLSESVESLQPLISYPNTTVRFGVDIVIGVPTVARKGVSYLLQTLQSIIFGMSGGEREKILIVVMVADEGLNMDTVRQQIASMNAEFNEYFDSGLLHVIVPPTTWYPSDLHHVEPTLGDPPERMYWRTKQNLDYLYLMLYCRTLGKYYLQIEDDVLAKKGFISTIHERIHARRESPWFTMDFSSLGFIGKLFQADNLQYLLQYIALLHRYKPVDWILDTVFYDRYCLPFDTAKNCTKAFKKFRPRGPTLFQHVGTQSSLKGKIQKLKERNFGETMSFNPHRDNPAANVTTSLLHYRDYSLERHYNGFAAFWSSQSPVRGDFIDIQFLQPTALKSILIRSGNAEHPKDILDNRTVLSYEPVNPDDFRVPTPFSDHGIARVNFDTATEVRSVRVEVNANYTNWVVISEFLIRT